MLWLDEAHATLRHHLAPLADALEAGGVADNEARTAELLTIFKESGAPALVVPRKRDGLEASELDLVRIQRAVGSFAPSLAVGTTMHHFSLKALVDLCEDEDDWMLVAGVARSRLLMASGFAEGRSGQSFLEPTMRAVRRDNRVFVSGSKKPCSLSQSMDVLTASIDFGDGPDTLSVAIVPAGLPGVERRPFWRAPVLSAAESDEVILTEVSIPEWMVVTVPVSRDGMFDAVQQRGLAFFSLLMCASYLGIASRLVEEVNRRGGVPVESLAELIAELESANLALEGVTRRLSEDTPADRLLAESLLVRYSTQDVLVRVANEAAALLGGPTPGGAADVQALVASVRALAFHPPAKSRNVERLVDYSNGAPLVVA